MQINWLISQKISFSLNLYFSSAIVNKALNDTEKVITKEIKANFNPKILQAIAELVTLPNNKTNENLKKFLESKGFTHIAQYVVGSAIIARGSIISAKTKKQFDTSKAQQFISSAQWTALVQKRLGDTMSRFGEPSAPNLKERSGRFRGSVQITANYRTNLLQFSYNPLYSSLQAYGYRPDLQVKRSIREVAQQLYAREFNIIKKAGI